MKKSINLNVLLARKVVETLQLFGVREFFVSPGSRSTPLIIALDQNKKLNSHVIIDERSNGFFALGLAKSSGRPVAIITTSGTAVAELYPAVIEAHLQRIPLIVCSADRPESLVNTGANQTIDQKNIFGNFCNYFFDSLAPMPTEKYFNGITNELSLALNTALHINPGPVQLNLRFEKPFENSAVTHLIKTDLYDFIRKIKLFKVPVNSEYSLRKNDIKYFRKLVESSRRILVMVGPSEMSDNDKRDILKLAKYLNAPILPDGLSNLRFGVRANNLLVNSSAFIRNRNLTEDLDPDLILSFYNAPTSNIILSFFEKSKATKILINRFGDVKDPSGTFSGLFKAVPSDLLELVKRHKINREIIDGTWNKTLLKLNEDVQDIKVKLIENSRFPSEARIINEIFSSVPNGSNVMLSNSVIPRDVDSFSNVLNKKVKVYHNRGPSGIDGIISTAAGIAMNSKKRAYLLIGDLAFLHDLNGLWLLKQFGIPLVIILINNGGGSIFEMLPIVKEKINFSKYFKVPPGMDFKRITNSFGGRHINIMGWEHFRKNIILPVREFTVLEIKTSSQDSLKIRKNYWDKVIDHTQKVLDEYSDR